MLTADLAQVRRKGLVLTVAPLKDAARQRARELLEAYHEVATQHVGASRGELEEALAAIDVEARDRKLALALAKLVDDHLDFELPAGVEPAELRRDLFAAASRAREAGAFDRDAVLAEVAAARGLPAAEIERSLYADLRDANLLVAVRPMLAKDLIDRWEILQAQAVLLRAVSVTARVTCRGGAAFRRLFHKLKFLRLLHEIHREDDDTVRIELDGPFSLFEQATRYGLQLAMALPALASCDRWSIDAVVAWGKTRSRARFQLAGAAVADAGDEPRLADEVQTLLERLRELDSPWRIAIASALLDLPGVGVCAPDLVFTHPSGKKVYLEVMGHWSRQAVWRRVELVQAGLRERVVFAVGQHLRVSEAALEGDLPGAIYVYKRTPHARTVLERVEALAAR